MDLSLSEEHEMLRDTARRFVDQEIVPYAAEWDRQEAMDPGIVKKLAEMGYLGVGIPAEYGGTPADQLAYCILMEELGRGDSSVRGIVSGSGGLVAKTILLWGNEDQRQRWLPAMCAGEAIGCFGLTEPGSGTDAGSLITRAVQDGDDWIIDGSKIFITNGTWANVALVFARTGGPGGRGVTCFLVDTTTPGFSSRKITGKLGMRCQDTAELTFSAMRVPDSARLGDLGRGFKIAMTTLTKTRLGLAAGCVGLGRASLEAAVRYSTEREQFGKPIASFQLIQRLLADMAVEVDAARLLVWRAADLIDRGEPFETESSMAKYFATEASIRAADAAIQVHGGYGYIDEFPVGRYLRDARVSTIYEGTSQIQQLIIGRSLTGINAMGV